MPLSLLCSDFVEKTRKGTKMVAKYGLGQRWDSRLVIAECAKAIIDLDIGDLL
jgi:hypothetical protein